MSNLATTLVETAWRYPQHLAVQGADRALTCAELDELSARAAGGLFAHGVRPGDRVGLRLPYSATFAVLCFGALRTGAIALPLHPGLRSLEVRPRHDAHGARIVFASPDTTATRRIRPSDTALVQVGDDFLDQVEFWPQHTDVVDRADHDPAVVVRTDDPPPGIRDITISHRVLHDTALATKTLIDETTTAAHHASAPTFLLDGPHYGMDAAMLARACLRVTHESACTVSGGGHGEAAVLRPAPESGWRR